MMSDEKRYSAGDDDDSPKDLSHITPAYRRALWIVVALNAGYAIVEITASLIGRSEALKADALDFFGDGVITGMGLLAIKWSLIWRARAALIQGFFLAALGLGVIGTAIYRVFVLNEPEPKMMGLFGGVALIVNVIAALVLIPHRTGDANVRAVWLFSRNDAIGNFMVLIAAALVIWTGTRWPDLAAAAIIAVLFLHSAWSIIEDARNDLKRANGKGSNSACDMSKTTPNWSGRPPQCDRGFSPGTQQTLTMEDDMNTPGKEIAKFLCGAEAFHAFVHAVLWLSGTTVSIFGISATPTWSMVSVFVNAAIALVLGLYAWGPYGRRFHTQVRGKASAQR